MAEKVNPQAHLMQQAYIAQITNDDSIRIIFTASIYQAHLFSTLTEANVWLIPAPTTLQLRDGSTLVVAEFQVMQLPDGCVISCMGPFDFTESQLIAAMPIP